MLEVENISKIYPTSFQEGTIEFGAKFYYLMVFL